MKSILPRTALAVSLVTGCLALTQCASDPLTEMNAASVNPRHLAAESRSALKKLYRQNPSARHLGQRAKGIIVFPEIVKGGFMVGGMGGNGALIRNDGTIRDFYQTVGASYGLQAGVQKYGYALFLMDNAAFSHLESTGGWELGSAPSIVVVDEGMASSITTTTMNKSTYAFFFNQRGLMGGIGLQGTKITRITPPR